MSIVSALEVPSRSIPWSLDRPMAPNMPTATLNASMLSHSMRMHGMSSAYAGDDANGHIWHDKSMNSLGVSILEHRLPIRSEDAEKHIFSFFHTIHVYTPLLDEDDFREMYRCSGPHLTHAQLSQPVYGNDSRPQFVCLSYAVLALGALHEIGMEGSSPWAPRYFEIGKKLLGALLDSPTLSLVQAAIYLVSCRLSLYSVLRT